MESNLLPRERKLSILVIEDDTNLRDSILTTLDVSGYAARGAATAAEGLQRVEKELFDLIFCDLKLPDMDGLEFIRSCQKIRQDVSIVLMTAFGSNELAMEAIRTGAYDYLSKPFSMDELIFMIRKIEEREKLRNENAALKEAISQRYNFSNIVARSESMRSIFETVKRLSGFNTTVLLEGESGTGKELLAKAIHQNSPRRGQPFVAINCGAIPESLMESELFGHKKGAFTDASRDKKGLFEEASGGTIFLDEIGEMPLHLQVKLLRALQEQKIRRVGDEQTIDVDVRVVAATLRDLEQDVMNGRFRDDLYYRLNVVSIRIPPLRERQEDIPLLIEHLIKKHNKRLGLNIVRVQPDAMRALMDYHWRGNVRELENCIERALVLTESDSIDMDSLPDHVRNSAPQAPRHETTTAPMPDEDAEDSSLSIRDRTRTLEIDLIVRALKKTKGNRTHAAKILEISHRALLYKLKEYGLADVEKK
jgi:two-component system, NtrC family, response regulator AtoC